MLSGEIYQQTVVAGISPVPPSGIVTGRELWVDSVNGVDATGTRGDFRFSFLTIQAAITAALSGDTIYVRPGTYSGSVTLTSKTNISIRLAPQAYITGAVTMTTCTNCGILGGNITPTGATVALTITGSTNASVNVRQITSATGYAFSTSTSSFYVKTELPMVTTGGSNGSVLISNPLKGYLEAPCFTDNNTGSDRAYTGGHIVIDSLATGSLVKVKGDIITKHKGSAFYMNGYTDVAVLTEYTGNINNASTEASEAGHIGIFGFGVKGEVILNSDITMFGNGRGLLIQTNSGNVDNSAYKIVFNGQISCTNGAAYSIATGWSYNVFINGLLRNTGSIAPVKIGDGNDPTNWGQRAKTTLSGRVENTGTADGILMSTLGATPQKLCIKNLTIYTADASQDSITIDGDPVNVYVQIAFANEAPHASVTELIESIAVDTDVF